MNPFVPDLILRQHARGVSRGSFEAATLFADVSGFTELTAEMVARGGRAGAEAMATALRHYFDPLVRSVHADGGFVSGFLGDAFTAIFEEAPDAPPAAARALRAAREMLETMAAQALYASPFGTFHFGLRVGVARGEVIWHVAAPRRGPRSFSFRGEAIDACARAQQAATPGEASIDPSLAPPEPLLRWESARRQDEDEEPSLDASPFCPPEVARFPEGGEMRSAVRLFIELRPGPDVEQRILLVQERANEYGGYLPRIDFGDKGCNAFVLFGVPTTREGEVERALDLVLELMAALGHGVRAGVSEDVGYAGWNGSRERRDLTCLGPATIAAARLMTKAPWGSAWCTARVAERGSSHELAPVAPLTLKGFAGAVTPFELRGRVARARIAGRATGAPTIAGRHAARAAIERRLEALAEDREGGALYLDGEAGSGKSLALDWARAIAAERGINWLDARCDRTLRAPFNPYAHAMRHGREADGGAEFARARAGLLDLLEHRDAGADAEPPDPRVFVDRTIAAIVPAVRTLASQGPVVLAFDNARAMDGPSRRATVAILRVADELPLLVMFASRPSDDGSPWRLPVPTRLACVTLGPMALPELWALLNHAAGEPVAEPLVGEIYERSDGNPQAAVQMLQNLRDAGSLRRAVAGLTRSTAALVAPEGPLAAFVAQLDRLPPGVRPVVEAASVLGLESDLPALIGLVDLPDVPALVEKGVCAGIWRRLPGGRVAFASTLLRDAAHEAIPASRRARLHQAAAEGIEARHGSPPQLHASLALHWEEAGQPDRARRYHALVAASALPARWTEEAARALGACVRLGSRRDVETIDARLRLASLLPNLGRPEEARRLALEAREDALALGLKQQEGSALLALAWRVQEESDAASALPLYEEAIACLKASGDPAAVLRALGTYARFLADLGRVEEGRALLEEALAQARVCGRPLAEAEMIERIAGLAAHQGRYEEARAGHEAALAIARQHDAKHPIAHCLANLGSVLYVQGRTLEALEACEEAFELSAHRGSTAQVAPLLEMMGAMHYELGDEEQARSLFERGLAHSREQGSLVDEANALQRLADLHRLAGRTGEAAPLVDEALALATHTGNPRSIAIVLECRALLLADTGRPSDAAQALERALELHRTVGNRAGEGIVLMRQATLERQHGDYGRASQVLREAEHVLAEVGDLFEVAKAVVERGQLEIRAGRNAHAHLEEAERRAASLRIAPGRGPLGREIAALRAAIAARDA